MKRNKKKMLAMGTIMVMLLTYCMSAFAADTFSVYDDNGYTGLITECDFEAFNVGDSTNVNWWFSNSFTVAADPIEGGTHGKVAFFKYVKNASLQFSNSIIDPWYGTNNNSATNPEKVIRNKLAQAKFEMDICITSTALPVTIYMQDYDVANEQGQGVRPRHSLIRFKDAKMTLLNAPADAELKSYEANKWYHFTFYVDCVNGTYTCYRDEELMGEDLRLYVEENLTGIAPVAFGVTYGGTTTTLAETDGVYLDNLRHSIVPMKTREFSVKKEVLEDNFNNYSTGEMPSLTSIKGGFGTNGGDIELRDAEVDSSTHQKVIRMYARKTAGDGTVTKNDSFLRSAYLNVQPNKSDTTVQLSGDELNQAKKLVVSMDIMLSGYDRGYLHYVDAKASGAGEKTILTFRPEGYMEITSTTNRTSEAVRKIGYEPKKWYSIRIYFDFDGNPKQWNDNVINTKGTYTLCINGKNVIEDEPLPSEGDGAYPISFGYHFATTADSSAYIEIDNFSMHQVDCVTTPKLSRIQQKAGEYKLICMPGQEVDMILSRYDATGKILKDVQISRGQANTYRMLNVKENADYSDRLYWWQLNTLKPIADLPELTD